MTKTTTMTTKTRGKKQKPALDMGWLKHTLAVGGVMATLLGADLLASQDLKAAEPDPIISAAPIQAQIQVQTPELLPPPTPRIVIVSPDGLSDPIVLDNSPIPQVVVPQPKVVVVQQEVIVQAQSVQEPVATSKSSR